MCFIEPILRKGFVGKNLYCFILGHVRKERRYIVGNQNIVVVELQLLDLFSKLEHIRNCVMLTDSYFDQLLVKPFATKGRGRMSS